MPYLTVDNHRIHYREQGQGPLLFILPGNTASSALHTNELEFFAGLGYHAVSPDFAGTGQSDRLPHPWPLDWFQRNAADCVAIMDQLGQQKAVVAGTSGGAIVALWMAILYPQRVQAVLSDSEGWFYPTGMLTSELADRGQHTSGQVQFWSDAHGPDWQEVVAADTELLLALESAGQPQGGWDIFDGRLHEIRCPVLFSCSLTDSLIPGVGKQTIEMAATLPESWLFSVNGGDHPLMWSRPAAYQAIASQFLAAIQPK